MIAKQRRHEPREVGNVSIHATPVAIADDVERRHRHRLAVKRRDEFPGAVNAAIPVEPAAKAGTCELRHEKIDIGLGEPRRFEF
jgi:hypothetical protein